MSIPALLEIAVTSPEGAATAVAAGADRLEVCEALEIGGITSNPETVAAVLQAAGNIGVHALIRPRGGNFVYSEAETDLMLAQARRTAAAGVAGLVIGALNADGQVEADSMETLISQARAINPEIELTFHRAIDAAVDPVTAIGVLIDLGFTRVLSSGGAPAAPDGVPTLRAMAAAAGGRLQVMAGGGMRPETIATVLEAGVDAVHFSAKSDSADGSHWVTDQVTVKTLRSTVDACNQMNHG